MRFLLALVRNQKLPVPALLNLGKNPTASVVVKIRLFALNFIDFEEKIRLCKAYNIS